MKNKILLFMVLAIACHSLVSAREGEKRIGLSTGLSSEWGIKSLQWGIHFGYNLTERFRLMPSFAYYLPESDFNNMWEVNLNVHYALLTGEKYRAYPLAGPMVKYVGVVRLGANLGAGLDYALSDKVDLICQAHYQWLNHFEHFLFTLGVHYKF
jgi:outer membrane protein X